MVTQEHLLYTLLFTLLVSLLLLFWVYYPYTRCSFHKWVKSLSRVQLCSLPGSSVHGIFQARILEWVAISFSRRSSRFRDWTRVSRTAGRLSTVWATREAPFIGHHITKAVYKVIAAVSNASQKKKSSRESPGGPEVRTPHFHWKGHRSLAGETCMP